MTKLDWVSSSDVTFDRSIEDGWGITAGYGTEPKSDRANCVAPVIQLILNPNILIYTIQAYYA